MSEIALKTVGGMRLNMDKIRLVEFLVLVLMCKT